MNAIITGGSKGIGKAIAEKLVSEGVHVAICAREATELDKTVSALKLLNTSVNVFGFICDLRVKEAVLKFAKEALSALGSVQLLVNNAGTFIPGEIALEEDGLLEKLIETNLYSAYHLTRALLPSMKENKIQQGIKGHIFNLSSVAGLKPYEHGGSYSISKFALQGFSLNLREELKPFQIKVTTINPGATMSDSWKGSDISEDRIMKSSDIADTIWAVYQLSPQAVVEEIVLRPMLGDL